MFNRNAALTGASLVLVFAIFLIRLWRPEHQVRLHQRDLLAALSDRDWKDFSGLIAENYSDRWGHDKENVVTNSREVFRQFFAVEVTGKIADIAMEPSAGVVTTTLQIQGRGGPGAEYAVSKVNALIQPWVFRWEKRSWKPWDWSLVSADQPELEVPRLN